MFRIKPGIDAHTHEFVKTGKIDSKFGVALENGEAFDIVKKCLKLDNIKLCGVHCHIGSQIFETEPFALAAKKLLMFIAKIRDELGYEMSELNIGGGFGIKYINSHDPKTPFQNINAAASALKAEAAAHNIKMPKVIIEPGRSIVGPAGITVYTVGSVKEIPGVRTYVSVNGGMTDNPRYALYAAVYEVVVAKRAAEKKDFLCTIAGRCCESGDLIAKDVYTQRIESGGSFMCFDDGSV